jgi:hypothetical protein
MREKKTPSLVIRGLSRDFSVINRKKQYKNLNFRDLKKEYNKMVSIDWISATLPYETTIPIVPHKDKELINGWNGYCMGWRLDSGVLIYLNPDREDMGLHIRISGRALVTLKEEYQMDSLVLVARLLNGGAKLSRLDLALDIKDGGLDVMEFVALAELKLFKGEVRKFSYIVDGSDGRGKTLYMGRRTSIRSLRIYDKGAETMSKTTKGKPVQENLDINEAGQDWIRFELELKQSAAMSAASQMVAAWKAADVNSDEWLEAGYKLIPGFIKGACDFPISINYETVCGKKGVRVEGAKKTETDTERWLFRACAPVLARLTVEQGREFKMLFLQHVSDLEKEMRDDKVKKAELKKDAETFDDLTTKWMQ